MKKRKRLLAVQPETEGAGLSDLKRRKLRKEEKRLQEDEAAALTEGAEQEDAPRNPRPRKRAKTMAGRGNGDLEGAGTEIIDVGTTKDSF